MCYCPVAPCAENEVAEETIMQGKKKGKWAEELIHC